MCQLEKKNSVSVQTENIWNSYFKTNTLHTIWMYLTDISNCTKKGSLIEIRDEV